MAKLIERMDSAETMKGKITISFQSGESYSGVFTYMHPGKIYVKFNDPPGKIIVTNGKKLWVYDSSTDVCGVQELDTEDSESDKEDGDKQSGEIKAKLMGGISKFFRTYEASISENTSQSVIELVNDNRKYSDIKFIVNLEFLLTSAVFKDKNGDGFVIKLSDVKIGEKITPGVFDFKAPANAQVVKNPLDIR
ncbi:MAG: outer membrane lipoprotein carrier protein LolA [Spirochaetes bacterium]|nr:outer membrane lipoprotein carrier protein LolA [Spirochaetota bacterium]